MSVKTREELAERIYNAEKEACPTHMNPWKSLNHADRQQKIIAAEVVLDLLIEQTFTAREVAYAAGYQRGYESALKKDKTREG